MDDAEYQELEELRAFKLRYELTEADYKNPTVLLIEGELDSDNANYQATNIETKAGIIYLAEAIEDFIDYNRKDIISFQYHISSEPFGFYELEEHMVKTSMGLVKSTFRHQYSDLTGYLWTNEKLEVGGHDLLEELRTSKFSGWDKETESRIKTYIALRIEKQS